MLPSRSISYALWMNRYQRDPRIVGRSIELNRRTYSIIGVMPRNFEFPADQDGLPPTDSALGSHEPHAR
jgi:hypothetical protein